MHCLCHMCIYILTFYLTCIFLSIQGLLNALDDLMPGIEHRFCVRHLHANFKAKGFKGKEFKDALWGAARAPNEIQFKHYLSVIRGMHGEASDYIDKIDPKLWARHAFRTTSCSDILLNNIAESFNAWILEARDQPILTCFETIRRQIMNRFNQKRGGAVTATNVICPKIMKKLERNKSDARNYICHWSNKLQFEVDSTHEARRVVDLEQRTCGCGRWQLNGIPCPHAIAAIYLNHHKPEQYVSKWYLMDTFRQAYACGVNPMPGPDDWPADRDVDPIDPPEPRKQRGRPKKQRKREPYEQKPDESIKICRKGYNVQCGNCGKKGHNARGCSEPEHANRKKYPKKVKKPKTDVVSLFLTCGITII